MDNVKQYVKTIENELIQANCVIAEVNIDSNLLGSVFMNIFADSGNITDIHVIFKKYGFYVFGNKGKSYIYMRKLPDILNELRREGFKELMK